MYSVVQMGHFFGFGGLMPLAMCQLLLLLIVVLEVVAVDRNQVLWGDERKPMQNGFIGKDDPQTLLRYQPPRWRFIPEKRLPWNLYHALSGNKPN